MTSKNLHEANNSFLQKYGLDCMYPLHQNCIYIDLPVTSLEQFFRAIWNVVSWAIILILSQINLAQKFHIVGFCFFFFLVKMVYVMKQNGFSNKSGLNVEFVVSQIYHSSFLNSKFYQGRLDFTFINQSSISMPYSSKFFVEILDINRHLDFKNAEKRSVLINYQVIMYANLKIISYFILHTKLCLVHSYWNLEKKWKHVDEVKSFQISEVFFFFHQ